MSTLPAQLDGTVDLAGRSVARMGYGAMGLGQAVLAERVSHEAGVRLLRRALDLGVQAYDTAQFYGIGTANEVLRDAFAGRRDEVCLISKVGAKLTDHGPRAVVAGQRPEELRQQVELNLRTLSTDHLDVVYLRRMDEGPGLIADAPDQQVSLDDQLAEMVALRDAGLIRAIGMSHVSLAQVRQALPVGIASVSNIYSILNRRHEDLLRFAEEHHIVWSPYFPLGAGGLGHQRKVGDDPVVQQVANSLGVTANQVGLAWLLARSAQALVIAGTTSLAHLDENVAAAGIELPTEALKQLDALGG